MLQGNHHLFSNRNLHANTCHFRGHGFNSGWRKSSADGNRNLLQYSCLENTMERETWRARVHGVAKSHTWLSDSTTTDIPVVYNSFAFFRILASCFRLSKFYQVQDKKQTSELKETWFTGVSKFIICDTSLALGGLSSGFFGPCTLSLSPAFSGAVGKDTLPAAVRW